MAGKGKKQGNRHSAPSSARGMMGHMGTKSSALAPTDSKLMSQYLVLDRMAAHYRNLSKAKPVIDNKTPKAWVDSQKAKDRARRRALSDEEHRRSQWLSSPLSSRPPTRDSERDRDDMIAMMESFSGLDDLDEVDNVHNISSSVSTTKANRLNEEDLNFVNNMVSDSVQSPSRYHSAKVMKTNIPGTNSSNRRSPHSNRRAGYSKKPQLELSQRSGGTSGRSRTGGDLIDKRSHKFTEPEKPFTPRTLKSKNEVQSRLSSFKYYTAPKKSAREPHQPAAAAPRSSLRQGTPSRPDTAYSDSVDLMNETLMSRDNNTNNAPMGVPPLDISLDADNMKWMKEHAQRGWLREQSRKAQLRSSAGTRSDAGSDLGSARPDSRNELKGASQSRTLNGTQNMTSRYPSSYTMMKMEKEEEELRYLEFITEVTNDILDRGIYTNRVLMQVFETHVERRKNDLDPNKMYDMLSDLRNDLGIPSEAGQDDFGSRSMTTSDYTDMGDPSGGPAARRRQTPGSDEYGGGFSRGGMRGGAAGRRRVGSGGEGRPPLPRPGSRGSKGRPSSSGSNLQEVKEEVEEVNSLTFTSDTPPTSATQSHATNILKVEHDDYDTRGDEQEGVTLEVNSFENGSLSLSNGHQDEMQANDDLVFAEQEASTQSAPRGGATGHDTDSFGVHSANGSMGEPSADFESHTEGEQGRHAMPDERLSFSENLDDDNGNNADEEALHDMYATAINDSLNQDQDSLNHEDGSAEHYTEHEYTQDEDFHDDEEDRDTLRDEDAISETPKTPPRPTPRSRRPLGSTDFTPRSTEPGQTTTESVTVSELGTEDGGDF